jgi:hypothetical protein
MISIVLLGIGASLFTEAVTWLDSKLSNSTLHGHAAFLLALAMSVIVGIAKVTISHLGIDLSHVVALVSEVFAVSQVWFYLIQQKIGFTVPS